jgi:hypothetical protein
VDTLRFIDRHAALLSAAATLLAVLVALFPLFVAKLFPPKLSLRVADVEGEMGTIELTSQVNGVVKKERTGCRYYHVWVSNSRRWSSAHEVQVALLRVEEPGVNGDLQTIWSGGPLPIEWQHQPAFPTARTIGPAAKVDLCSVVKGSLGKGRFMALHPMITPFNLEVQKTQACVRVLTLQARGTQGDSALLRVKISWDGGWHDEDKEMRRHMAVDTLDAKAS